MTSGSFIWSNLRRSPTRGVLSLAAVATVFALFGLTLGITEGIRAAALVQGMSVQPAVLVVAVAISTGGVLVIVLLTASAMAHAIRGRTAELAVMAAVGFSPRRILMLLVGEAAAICLPGAALGLCGAKSLFAILNAWLPGLAVIPSPIYTPPLLLLAGALALVVSVATVALPGRRLARADVALLLQGSVPALRKPIPEHRSDPLGGSGSTAQQEQRSRTTAAALDLDLFRQIAVVTRIALSTMRLRSGGSILVVASSCAVVFLLLLPLTVADSLRSSLASGGDPARVVIRSSASALLHLSRVPDELIPVIAEAPGVAMSPEGKPLVQRELFAWPRDLVNRGTGKGGYTNVVGVSPEWLEMTPEFRLLSGRMPRPGNHEVIVGTLAAAKFSSLDRKTVDIGDVTWRVVGTFTTGGWWDGYIVTDAADMRGLTLRQSGTAIRVRLSSPEMFDAFQKAVAAALPPSITLEREPDHYRAFWRRVPKHLVYIAFVVAGLISAGVALGTTLVIETALDSRRRETATLRLLGFDSRAVAASVVLEGMVLTVGGALIGTLLAWLVMDGRIVNGAWGVSQLAVSHRLLFVAIGWGVGIAIAGTSVLALRTLNTTALEAIRQLRVAIQSSIPKLHLLRAVAA